MCRFCCKSPKIPGDDFFENKEAKLNSPINMAPRPLAKSPVSFSPGDEVPHIFIRESHQRPRKKFDHGGKRLLKQNRHQAKKSARGGLSAAGESRHASLREAFGL